MESSGWRLEPRRHPKEEDCHPRRVTYLNEGSPGEGGGVRGRDRGERHWAGGGRRVVHAGANPLPSTCSGESPLGSHAGDDEIWPVTERSPWKRDATNETGGYPCDALLASVGPASWVEDLCCHCPGRPSGVDAAATERLWVSVWGSRVRLVAGCESLAALWTASRPPGAPLRSSALGASARAAWSERETRSRPRPTGSSLSQRRSRSAAISASPVQHFRRFGPRRIDETR